jgi:hypothetical protein
MDYDKTQFLNDVLTLAIQEGGKGRFGGVPKDYEAARKLATRIVKDAAKKEIAYTSDSLERDVERNFDALCEGFAKKLLNPKDMLSIQWKTASGSNPRIEFERALRAAERSKR